MSERLDEIRKDVAEEVYRNPEARNLAQRDIAWLLERCEKLEGALRDCEENLRLIHDAAGTVPKGAPMPRCSTFTAWHNAAEALGLIGGPVEAEPRP